MHIIIFISAVILKTLQARGIKRMCSTETLWILSSSVTVTRFTSAVDFILIIEESSKLTQTWGLKVHYAGMAMM